MRNIGNYDYDKYPNDEYYDAPVNALEDYENLYPEPPPKMTITSQTIGSISDLDNGRDEYVLLTRTDGDDLTPKQAHDWLLPRVYRETHAEAGGYFCNSVSVQQVQYSTTQVIAIIAHRYDI